MTLDGTGFVLEVRKIASVFPHEETIPSHVVAIGSEMKSDGVQRDPVLVDKASGVVLDGMHRLAALRKMGHSNVITCSVDYSKESIGLSRWARVFHVGETRKAEEAISQSGLGSSVKTEEAEAGLAGHKYGLAGFVDGKALVPEGMTELAKAFELVRRLDSLAALNRWPRTFRPEGELDLHKVPEGAAVVLVRRLTKDDVLDAGRSGRLFPCKTSMHWLDPRPVAVNYPIQELDGASASSLRERLSKSDPEMLEAGSVYEGRKYKERLLMLSKR